MTKYQLDILRNDARGLSALILQEHKTWGGITYTDHVGSLYADYVKGTLLISYKTGEFMNLYIAFKGTHAQNLQRVQYEMVSHEVCSKNEDCKCLAQA